MARLDDVLQHAPDARAVRGMEEPPPEAPRPPARLRHPRERLLRLQRPRGAAHRELQPYDRTRPAGGLVGSSGSGKSTIRLKLACGLLKPCPAWCGSTDAPSREVPPAHLTETISYVDQEIVLFEGSVRDNVTLWNPLVEDHYVARALRDAAVLDEVMSGPASTMRRSRRTAATSAAGSASVWRSPARSRPIPPSWCSTKPPLRSIR